MPDTQDRFGFGLGSRVFARREATISDLVNDMEMVMCVEECHSVQRRLELRRDHVCHG